MPYTTAGPDYHVGAGEMSSEPAYFVLLNCVSIILLSREGVTEAYSFTLTGSTLV